jgi:pyruvate dehydrogenase E1 component alpha subunit
MPREKVETPSTLEHLSILDENGELDRDLEPDLADALLERMHRKMLLARRFDERMLSLQRQGRIGTFAPVRGQEATQIGSAAALEAEDWVVPSYREIAVNLWRGLPLEGMLIYNAGYNEGGRVPDEHNDLPVAIPVGTQMLHAAGLAYGLRLQGSDRVALTYFGDGATSQGDFHEALNFSGVFRCPVVFLCQNNQWAISVPREKQTSSRTLAQKAFAYDVACLQVDGNDVLAVHVATCEAVARAREEQAPTLVECITYRLGVHTTVDDPSKYREEEEVEAWEKRDPLPRFQAYLKEKGLLDDDEVAKVEQAVEQEIAEAVERWQERSSELEKSAALFDHLYAEAPPYLEEQRQEFEAEWRERDEAAGRSKQESEGADRDQGRQAKAKKRAERDEGKQAKKKNKNKKKSKKTSDGGEQGDPEENDV